MDETTFSELEDLIEETAMNEMTFSDLEDMIEEVAEEVQDAPDFEKTALAAEQLLGWTESLGLHTARFARIAWRLDMLFCVFALLVLYGGLFFPRLSGLMPLFIRRPLGAVYRAGGLTRDVRVWMFCILVLTVLPLLSDVILSILCKNTPVKLRGFASGAGNYNELQRIKTALYNAQGELNPTSYLPPWTVYAVGLFYLLPLTARIIAFGGARDHSTIGKLFLTICSCWALFLLTCGVFVLLLWLKLLALSLCFSSASGKRALEEVLEELPEYEAQYRSIEESRQAEEAEQKRLADLKEGAELYRRATAEGTVNRMLLAKAAEKGDPQANLEMGKNIVEKADGLNRREVAALYEDAKKHFRIADEADLPDGILMYASARLMTEAHDVMGWLNILRRLRTVERIEISAKLRNIYNRVRDQLIERVQLAMAHAEREE